VRRRRAGGGRGNGEKKPCKRETTETTVARKVVCRSCRGGGECVQSALKVRRSHRDCIRPRARRVPPTSYLLYIVCKYLYWETVVVRAFCGGVGWTLSFACSPPKQKRKLLLTTTSFWPRYTYYIQSAYLVMIIICARFFCGRGTTTQ